MKTHTRDKAERAKRRSEIRLKLMLFLGKVCDFLLIGLISLICSLPLITLGAAAAAFYTEGVDMIRGEEGSVYRDYFRAFKEQFRHVTPIWIVLLVFQILLIANVFFYFWYASAGAVWAQFGLGICGAVALLLSFAGSFLFPILAKNEDLRGRDAIRFSFLLALKQLKWWALKFLVQAVLIIAAWFFPFLILFLPGALLFWNSFCYDRAFKSQFPENNIK